MPTKSEEMKNLTVVRTDLQQKGTNSQPTAESASESNVVTQQVQTPAAALDPNALLNRVRELEDKLHETDTSPDYDPNDSTDDRNDLVTITYGATLREFVTQTVKKREAVDILYNAYAYKQPTGKNVPKFGPEGASINDAPCYVKIQLRDQVTRKITNYYKDMPIWILVDRMINHPNTYLRLQLVRREEYQASQDRDAALEYDWASETRKQKIAQAAEVILKNQ